MKPKLSTALLALACGALSAQTLAQTPTQTVEVRDAWVRSTVPGQKGSGAFMSIKSSDGAQLVGASSPVAGLVEVHEMKMKGDVMTMRAVPVLELPAGQTVQLKPGGYHFMLTDLKQPLPRDSKVPLTLRFKDGKGVESKLELMLPASLAAPSAADHSAMPNHAAGASAQHGGQKH
jgi:periplasmic copper chaperone A